MFLSFLKLFFSLLVVVAGVIGVVVAAGVVGAIRCIRACSYPPPFKPTVGTVQLIGISPEALIEPNLKSILVRPPRV